MHIKRILKHPAFILVSFMLIYICINITYLAPDKIYTTDSYFNIRQIEYIRTQGVPMVDDDLSLFTKMYYFTPLFHYIMAVFLTFFSEYTVFKIIPILISSCTIPAAYLFLTDILSNRTYIYISSFFIAFIPGIFLTSINNISPMTLFIPLFILFLFSIHKIRFSPRMQYLLMGVSIALAMTHPLFLACLAGIILYFFVLYITNKRIYNAVVEFVFFLVLFCTWFFLLIYKKYLHIYGVDLLSMNLPQAIRLTMFPDLSIGLVLSAISIVIILVSSITVYQQYMAGNTTKINILFSMTMVFIILMYVHVLAFGMGIILLSITLFFITAIGFETTDKYMKKTYMAKFRWVLTAIIIMLLTLTIMIPSLYYAEHGQEVLTKSEYAAFNWIQNYSKQEAVIFVSPDTGQAAAYLTKRTIFFDEKFLGFPNLDELNNDIIKSAKYEYGLESIKTFTNVTYIIETPRMTKYLQGRFTIDERFDCMNEVKEFGSKEDLSYARIIFNKCKVTT